MRKKDLIEWVEMVLSGARTAEWVGWMWDECEKSAEKNFIFLLSRCYHVSIKMRDKEHVYEIEETSAAWTAR